MSLNIGNTVVFGSDGGLYNLTGTDQTTKNTLANKLPHMNLNKWVNVKGSRNPNQAYQNTDGQVRHVFILVDFNFNRNSNNILELSSNNSTWFTIGKTRGMQQSISISVPDGWWYRFSNGMPIITWLEGDV